MPEHELRSCQSVNRPYARVKQILAKDALGLFQRATATAAAHAELLDATMKATVAGRQVEKSVRVEVTSMDHSGRPPSAMALPGFALALTWRATSASSLFPSMRAELTVYQLSHGETQLDLHGWYTPPGGVIGAVADAIVGHRIAEASVHHFLDDVVRSLGTEIT
jgi:hypothetical protein